MTVRSSSVRPFGSRHKARSAVMLISCGIQWLAQPSRYFCHAQSYLNGTSWFKSARQLMIFLSSTWMRDAPISISSRPVPVRTSSAGVASSMIGLTEGAAPAVAISCSLLTMPSPACGFLLAVASTAGVSSVVSACSKTCCCSTICCSITCCVTLCSAACVAASLAGVVVLVLLFFSANFAKGSSQLLSILVTSNYFCPVFSDGQHLLFYCSVSLWPVKLLAGVAIWIKD